MKRCALRKYSNVHVVSFYTHMYEHIEYWLGHMTTLCQFIRMEYVRMRANLGGSNGSMRVTACAHNFQWNQAASKWV